MKDLIGAIAYRYVNLKCPFYYLNPYQELGKEDYYEKYVKKIAGGECNVSVKNPWTYINWNRTPQKRRTIGWKIHISSMMGNHIEILIKVSEYCAKNKIDYRIL